MKKFILLPLIVLPLTSCAFFEFNDNEKKKVDMGDGDTFVKWSLVDNNNAYHPVQSAYFEISKTTIRYYEENALIKEGSANTVYFGAESTTAPLIIQLDFGRNENKFDVYDNLYCFTEDEKDNLHQFTIMAQGYHIKPLRNGGVPVRDYHLSEMPYAMGTYVKEGTEQYTYQNSTDKDITADKLTGSFVDASNNKFYFINNCFYRTDGYYLLDANIYFRYENNVNNVSLEGTICLSYHDSYELNRRVDVALLYVMHGQSEPQEAKGVYADPDYNLIDFTFAQDGSLSFSEGTYFYDVRECDWDPANFVPGTYMPSQN